MNSRNESEAMFNMCGMPWEEIFLKEAIQWVVGEGNLNEISEHVVVGLGGGLDELVGRLEDKRLVGGSVYTGTYKACRVSVVARYAGPMGVESLIRVLGLRRAKTVIGVGWCGGLQERVNIGDIVIPVVSIRGENLTDYYAPREVPAMADHDVLSALIETSQSLGCKSLIGPIISTPMQLKETEELINKWSKLGLLGVECECSTLFLLSQLEGIKAGASLAVSDSPLKKQTHTSDKTLDEKQKEAFSNATTIAFESMVKLIKKEWRT
jgi:uridine phosphorylase